MSSRLTRLLQLLDAGSNPLIRSHAAQQIADIQRDHPHKLHTLLAHLQPFLYSDQWTTRVAAAHALDLLCAQLAQQIDRAMRAAEEKAASSGSMRSQSQSQSQLSSSSSAASSTGASSIAAASSGGAVATPANSAPAAACGPSSSHALLHLSGFSSASVMSKGTLMLAAAPPAPSHTDAPSLSSSHKDLRRIPVAQRVVLQRAELLKRLGLYEEFGDAYEGLAGVDTLLQESDVADEPVTAVGDGASTSAAATSTAPARNALQDQLDPPPALPSAAAAPPRELSARERNKAKRDAKAQLKRRREESNVAEREAVIHASAAASLPPDDAAAAASKKARVHVSCADSSGDTSANDPSAALLVEPVPSSHDGDNDDPASLFLLSDGSHVLTPYVKRLLWDLLDLQWERRHGAALGLRSIAKHHAQFLGCDMRSVMAAGPGALDRSSSIPAAGHASFLSDTCARLLCVLILDRFGDYAHEKLVCPVRETAAQVLAVLSARLGPRDSEHLVRHLVHMGQQKDPELRYGAFLGLQYVLAVRFGGAVESTHSSAAAGVGAVATTACSITADRDGSARADVNAQVLHLVLQPLIVALQDSLDDVRGMVADSLATILRALVATHNDATRAARLCSSLLRPLWAALLLCDDLTSSTNNILALLCQTYTLLSETRQTGPAASALADAAADASPATSSPPLPVLLQRLYPFFTHSLLSVRHSAWKCIVTMLRMAPGHTAVAASHEAEEQRQLEWTARLVRMAFQSVLLESHAPLVSTCLDAISLLSDTSQATSSTAPLMPSETVYRRLCDATIPACLDLLLAPLFQRVPARLIQQLHASGSGATEPLPEELVAPWNDVLSTLDMKLRGSKALGVLFARLGAAPADAAADAAVVVDAPSGHAGTLLRLLSSPHDLYAQVSCLILCEWWSIAHELTRVSVYSHSLASSPEWAAALLPQLDPTRVARVRSPNTNALLAQTLIEAHRVSPASALTSAQLRLCVPPLLFTLEFEQRFVVLQERAARYLAVLLRHLLLLPSREHGFAGSAVKREEGSMAEGQADRVEADRVVACAVAMLCASIPPPHTAPVAASIAPPHTPHLGAGVKMEEAEEVKTEPTADEEMDLLAMLKAEDEPEPQPAVQTPHPATPKPTPAPPATARRSKKQKHAHGAPTLASAAAAAAATAVLAAPNVLLPSAVAERGGRIFFEALCAEFRSEEVLGLFPSLWHRITEALPRIDSDNGRGEDHGAHCSHRRRVPDERAHFELCEGLQLLLHLLPHLPSQDHPRLLSLLPSVARCLFLPAPFEANPALGASSPSSMLPLLTRNVFVAYVRHMATPSMAALLQLVLPALTTSAPTTSHGDSDVAGAAAAGKLAVLQLLEALLSAFTVPLLPYLPFLVQPVLACMSDSSTAFDALHTEKGSVETTTSLPTRSVRERACGVFAQLMPLVPLEVGVESPADMPASLHSQRLERRLFLHQLVDGGSVPPVSLPAGLLAPGVLLRQYQLDGVKWLMFLYRFSLHGILCDEMGLGKTLQTQVMMALTIYERRQRLREELDKAAAARAAAPSSSSVSFSGDLPASALPFLPLPSLILCPTTLLHHWEGEFSKFINAQVCPLHVVLYTGTPAQKAAIRERLLRLHSQPPQGHSTGGGGVPLTSPTLDPILIMSYESARKDACHFQHFPLHHLVLDEGHLLRNPTTLLSRAVKSLRSEHRLILSGTPVSNQVLEVWSLFDFLMPGYLGSEERDFQRQFARPIQRARNVELDRGAVRKRDEDESGGNGPSAALDKQQSITAAGNMALENLHKRVLPFLLRRLKSDVLADLPPKIVQDVTVDLSPLQRYLYQLVIQGQEDAIAAHADRLVATPGGAGVGVGARPQPSATAIAARNAGASKDQTRQMHTFQALHYLRKLCSHPSLVLSEAHPQYAAVQAKFFSSTSSPPLRSLVHAPKLAALKELLVECGIGAGVAGAEGGASAEGSVDVDSLLAHEHERSAKRKHSKPSKRKARGGSDADAPASPGELASITSLDPVVSGHRVLIFAQLRSTLDIIERDLFNAPVGPPAGASASASARGDDAPNPDGFPRGAVSYLRLDGSTPASRRFDLVRQFNSDPSIDAMLLSTSVGGLGLNLTGADVCIFVEHDWNPQRDAQALDRAHRIGQRRTVHCYRLVCRDSLEQRIMGLQRFKLHLANSVVNADNADLAAMDTERIVDRLQHAATTQEKQTTAAAKATQSASTDASLHLATAASSASSGAAALGLSLVADESAATALNADEYGEEFDVSAFLRSCGQQ